MIVKRNRKEDATRLRRLDREVNGMGRKGNEMRTRSNVAIAAAITAYARMGLTSHMKDENNPVYYHDTDSIVVSQPRPDRVVGKERGEMKLEYVIKEGVFAGPKLYSLRVEGGKEVVKAKGYGSKGLRYENYKNRLAGETMERMKEY